MKLKLEVEKYESFIFHTYVLTEDLKKSKNFFKIRILENYEGFVVDV